MSVGTNDLLSMRWLPTALTNRLHTCWTLYTPVSYVVTADIHQWQRPRHPVTVCGEMAGDRRCTRLLLALGLRSFSMHPGRILK
jgi:phosphotransferase system enzyme I (PtsI)